MDASPACVYCNIIFIGTDSVYAAQCGHLFHDICLNKVFSGNTKYCPDPNCAIRCNEIDKSRSMRVYLPFSNEPSNEESLTIELKKMKHERKEVQKELGYATAEQSVLEAKIVKAGLVIEQKKKKLSELKSVNKEKENLQNKLKSLEKMYAVQKALAGTSGCVNKILQQKPPADTLATMAVSVARETKRVKAENEEMRSGLREDQKENDVLAANYRNLRDKFQISVARRINKGDQN